MKSRFLAPLLLLAFCGSTLLAQSSQTMASGNDAPASAKLATLPWEYGFIFGGGMGVGDRSDFSFLHGGMSLGKVLTNEHLPGILRGQFEYAGNILPYWQAFTPPPHIGETKYEYNGYTGYVEEPYNGGTFSGVSITPIILRWDFKPGRRFAPYAQGAGGLIWTNHKFPPDIIVPKGVAGGTSVWNFSPQFGIGTHYFVRNGQSIDLEASAEHISSASLGDRNPGVNASVQFLIGYTWWH